MSSIVNFDRDLDYLSLNRTFLLFSTQHLPTAPSVTSDEIIWEQEASINYYVDTTSDSADSPNVDQCRSLGLNMIGPDITDGSPYRIQGYFSEMSGLYTIYIMYAVGPSSFSGLPAGDPVIGSMPLVSGYSHLNLDKTVYIPSFEFMYPGGGYEERPLSVYAMFRRRTGAPQLTVVSFRLSVQRLGVKPPDYKTANR